MMGKCLECLAHCTVIKYLIYKSKKEQSHRGSYKRLNFFVLPKYQQFSSGNQRLLLAWPIPLTCICSFYILLIGSTCVTGINFASFPDFSIGFQNSSATVFFFILFYIVTIIEETIVYLFISDTASHQFLIMNMK